MRFFVYEYITGGGQFLDGDDLSQGSLLREGSAMISAVCDDLGAIPGAQLCTLRDVRLPGLLSRDIDIQWVSDREAHQAGFDRLATQSDFTLLIAPEINGRLSQLTTRAEQLGAHLLSPSSGFVRLASDKFATVNRLNAAGVRVPATVRCRTAFDLVEIPAGPLVRKPIDGAGSWQVSITDPVELASWLDDRRDVLVQEFCHGRPASVAALCGAGQPVLLPPCWQLVEPPLFAYRGGQVIRQRECIDRAHCLARRALELLPPARGYVGIDMVLGESDDGSSDVVIEVNPRLTTSYVGIRQLAVTNLGHAMWQLATGHSADVGFHSRELQFDVAGNNCSLGTSSRDDGRF
jgi:predicted ATP-grasp superfamily ATP-dependent carboligase